MATDEKIDELLSAIKEDSQENQESRKLVRQIEQTVYGVGGDNGHNGRIKELEGVVDVLKPLTKDVEVLSAGYKTLSEKLDKVVQKVVFIVGVSTGIGIVINWVIAIYHHG